MVFLLWDELLEKASRPARIRKSAKLPIALLAIVVSVGNCQVNMWTSRGPDGGQVGILTDPQAPGTLYATSGQTTTFKTTDAAAHWRPLDTGSVRLLAVDPQNSGTLYGSSIGGLQRSADGGSTWSFAGAGLPVSRYQLSCVPSQLVFDPRNSSTLYTYFDRYDSACIGLFKSADGAATWTAASTGLPSVLFSYGINALLADPKKPATLYVSGAPIFVGGGVFQTSDGGASWSAIAGLPANYGGYVRLLAIHGQDSGTLYAFAYLDGGKGPAVPALYRSPDAGSSWSVMATGLLFSNLVADSHDAGTLYAQATSSLGAGIVKTTDAGANWRFILENTYAMALARTQTGPDILYGTGGVDGVLKSADGGTTWTAANDGLAATNITAVAVHPQDPGMLYALGTWFVYASPDGGRSWSAAQRCGDLQGVPQFAFDPGDPQNVYMSSGGLCATRDGGASWKQLLPPQHATYLPVPGPLTDSQGAIYYGNLKSTDRGASWQEIGMRPGVLGIDPRNPDTLYGAPDSWNDNALAIHSQLSKSLDGGMSWTPLERDWHGYLLTAVAVDPTNPDTVYVETGGIQDDFADVPEDYYDPDSALARDNCCLFRSDDGGANWVRLDVPAYSVYFGGSLGVDPRGTIYVKTVKGLLRSLDRGNTWSPVITAGLRAAISSIGFDPLDPNHLFAGTYGGGVFEIILAP